MSDGQEYFIAKGIDDPIPIFFLDPTDFTLLVSFFGLGIVTKQILVGVFLSWAVLKMSKIMKKGAKRGMMMHTMWRLGLTQDKKLKADPLKTDFLI